MLKVLLDRRSRTCQGTSRRDFLRIGGLGSLGLAQLLAARESDAATGESVKDTSVIWLWLSGGPSQIETFDPKLDAPVEFRSITGEVPTALPGITFGGTFAKMGQVADHLAIVRSFAHSQSSHSPATNRVMTGYENLTMLDGGPRARPSLGALTAKARGANHPHTGMPTFVALTRMRGDGPGFLGGPYAPFDVRAEAARNMKLELELARVTDRRSLLAHLDQFRRDADNRGQMDGFDKFETQAFNLIMGSAPAAFDLTKEDPRTVANYGPGLGEQLLIARRLCEAGCGFVNIKFNGWDHHGVNGTDTIYDGMQKLGVPLDHAVATLVGDMVARGLDRKILLVVTGEFGRSPRINTMAGRDHWGPLSTLALAGGGLRMGQVIGQSSAKAEHPISSPIGPQDLMATVFHVLGIDQKLQVSDNGRPVQAIEDGRPIRELV